MTVDLPFLLTICHYNHWANYLNVMKITVLISFWLHLLKCCYPITWFSRLWTGLVPWSTWFLENCTYMKQISSIKWKLLIEWKFNMFSTHKRKHRTKLPSKSEKLLIWCSNYTIQLTIFGRCIFGVFIKNNMFLSLSTAIKCCSVFMTMTTNVEYVRARYGTYLPQFTVHNSFSSIILIYCVTACSY